MIKLLFAATAAAALLSSQTLAADASSSVSVKLHFGRVNYDDPVQVQALYAHIQHAARQACFGSPDAAFALAPKDWDCVNQVVSEAVSKVGQPQLTALYENQSPTVSPRTRLAGNDQ